MECKQFLLWVSNYIDGTLARRESTELEEHLNECQKCRTLVNTLKATISLYKSLYDVPFLIHQSLHQVLRQEWEIHKVQVSIGVPKFPVAEVVELKKEISLLIELPGISHEDITLIATPDYIEISGFNKRIEGTYYLNEINYGPFSRKLRLPSPIDPSRAQAKLKNGILKIILPKI